MTRRAILTPLLALALAGCASSGGGTSSGPTDLITAEELANVAELNAYQAVQRLRPQWLTTRGRVSFSAGQGVRLYVNGVQTGFASDLTSMRASSVASMRFLSGREATARYGTDHGDGAILVTLR